MTNPETASPQLTDSHPEVVNIEHADVESVTASLVRMRQANAQTISADEVELAQSAAGMVTTTNFAARQSAVGGVNAQVAEVMNSTVGGVRADSVAVQGIVGGVAGGIVNVVDARVGVTAAREVRGEKIHSLVLIAGRVEGEVHTVVDTRGAILFGIVSGLCAGLIVLAGRMAFRRDE